MTFSQIEKKLIREMVANRDLVCLENLLDSHLKDGYSIYVDSQKSKLLIDDNIDTNTAISESIRLYRLIIAILFLLDNLENNKLIYSMKINSGVFPKDFGKCDTSKSYNVIDLFGDIRWIGLFEYYLNREILASEDLISLVANDFLTEEEKKFNKQYIAIWAGIILAFLGAIASPFIQNALDDKNQKECNCSIDINHELKNITDKNNSTLQESNVESRKK